MKNEAEKTEKMAVFHFAQKVNNIQVEKILAQKKQFVGNDETRRGLQNIAQCENITL